MELNAWDTRRPREGYNLVITVFGSKDGYVRNIITKNGTRVIYKAAGADHFISRLYNTTGNVLPTPATESSLRRTAENSKENPSSKPGNASVYNFSTEADKKWANRPWSPIIKVQSQSARNEVKWDRKERD